MRPSQTTAVGGSLQPPRPCRNKPREVAWNKGTQTDRHHQSWEESTHLSATALPNLQLQQQQQT